MEEAKFEKGEDVLYLDKGTGQQLPAVVRSIDYNCDPLSYTVHIPSLGSTRETVASRLTRVNKALKPTPGEPWKDAQAAAPAPTDESNWEQFEDEQQALPGGMHHHHQQQRPQQEAGQAPVPSPSHAKKHHKSHHQHHRKHAGGVDGVAASAAGSAGNQFGVASPGVEGQAATGPQQLHAQQHSHPQQQQHLQQQQQARQHAPLQATAADSVAYPQIYHHQQAQPAAHAPHPHGTGGPAGRAGQHQKQPAQQQHPQQHHQQQQQQQQQGHSGPSRRQQLRSSLPSWLGGAP